MTSLVSIGAEVAFST